MELSRQFSWLGTALLSALLGCTGVPVINDAPATGGARAGSDGSSDGGGSSGETSFGGDFGVGGAVPCDCGDGTTGAHLSLACACEHGLCSTFAEDEARRIFASPYYFRLGICVDGYRTLTYEQAAEQRVTSTYDAQGNLVYASYAGYFPPPAACGFEKEILGHVTIGDADPGEACQYCIITADDDRGVYPASSGPRCSAEQLR